MLLATKDQLKHTVHAIVFCFEFLQRRLSLMSQIAYMFRCLYVCVGGGGGEYVAVGMYYKGVYSSLALFHCTLQMFTTDL